MSACRDLRPGDLIRFTGRHRNLQHLFRSHVDSRPDPSIDVPVLVVSWSSVNDVRPAILLIEGEVWEGHFTPECLWSEPGCVERVR